MGLMTDAAVVNIEGNTKQLVDQINKADKAMQGFDKTLTDILSHLTAVENGLKNVNGTTQNITKNYKGNFFDASTNSFVGARGTAANYTSTRSKGYKEAQNKYIQTQKKNLELLDKQIEKEMQIARLKKEQAGTVNRDSLARLNNSEAKLLRAETAKRPEMLSYYAGLGLKHDKLQGFYDYKSAHPERFLAGALDWNPRYQGSRAIRGLGGIASNFGMGGKLVGSFLDTLGTFVKSPIAGAATAVTNLAQSVVDLGKSAVQSFSEIEAIKTQLGVVFSNQTQANSMFGQISQYAVKSPFGVQQTSELAVLLKQSGVYASDLMDTLRMLGDTAGGNMEKMKRIANNYAQIVSIGKASMLDMRQFAYAGIPIFEAVSKELGVSQQQLRKLISDGKVTSDIIEKVFKDLTGINGIFENATEKGAKTLKARLQNLADARQLAMGSMGQWIVNSGTKTGNDSYANRIVSGIENIYSWLQEHVDTKNIQNDVNTIANREDRIQKLESLIEYNKTWGTPDVVAGLEKILAQEKAKRDPDKDRATWVEAYKNARDEYNKLFESGELIKLNELEIKIKEQEDKINKMTANTLSNVGERYISGGYTATSGVLGFSTAATSGSLVSSNENINAAKEFLKYLEDLKNAILGSNKIQEQWIQAIREQSVIDAQQLAFDQANKFADTKNSLNYSFNELYEIWKDSDEQKEKAEQERLKRLQEAQDLLKKIADNTDELGNLDITSMSRSEYQDYKSKGAFTGERKLNVVEGKNASQLAADRALLEKQFAHNAGVIIEDIMKSPVYSSALGQNMVTAVNSSFMKLAGATSNEEFFKQFAVTFNEMSTSLDEMAKYDKNNADFYKALKEYLTDSTIQWNLKKEGVNADLSKKGDQFIPLWKRILAQYTGLSTTGMTSTVDTMQNYRDDMAIRNMARDTLLATMKSTDIATAMKLVAYNDKATLKGDSAATLQVDWKTTKENLKEFALRLSATTEVIDAYKKGLEDELDVYQQLIVAGITQGESQDANQQKFITTKQLAKMRLSNAQLVNAFGDTIETASGTKYGINEVYFDEQGKMFDKMGNEITEQVKITSNLSKFIESELPRIRKELLDASVQSANNKEFSRRLQEALPGILAGRLDTSTQYRGVLADYLRNNESYFVEQFNTIWEDIYADAKTNDRYKDILKGRSREDALTAAINATPETIKWLEDKGANGLAYDTRLMAELLDKALIRIEKEGAGSLGVGAEGESYRGVYNLIMNYLKRQEYDTAVIKRYSQLMGTDTSNSLSLTAYADQGGIGGVRGQKARMLRDAFGLEKGYDLESLYERARTGGQFRMSQNRLEYLKEKYGTTAQSHIAGDTIQWNNGELDNADATLKNMVEEVIRMSEASKDIRDTFRSLGSEMHSILSDFGKGSWEAPFEKMGESLVLGEQASESLDDVYKNLAAELLQASGAAMTKAGWELVARGAADKNYAMIAGGLALAGAGAFAAGIGTGLNQEDKEAKEAEDKAKRLEALKNNLADLLRQAREDAIYYENTLRHKKAISAADELTTRSVHDAIITPKGEVVTTDPKDYLIATKTPRTLVGGGAPTINFSVVDKSTGVRVTQQRSSYDEATNTIDFEAIIESKVAEVIASPKGDDAFNAREARLRGRSVIA